LPNPSPVPVKGARYFKADLHIHSPASRDFEDKKASPEDFVKAALSKGLEIIAVTDHNSAEWVDQVRVAAKRTALRVFPGVEVSTPTCHILAIFDRDAPKSRLDDFLSGVGIASEKRGKEDAVSEPAEDVLTKIAKLGGIAIAAHANSTNGLLQGGTGQYRIKLYHMEELAALEFRKEKDVQEFTQGKISGYGPRACVQGSDAHSLATMGEPFTYLKMDGVSLRGLKQALLDYEVRIRFKWNAPPSAAHPRILRMTASQGFFGGSVFDFHPNLNCFIGGKGTGKSTVIEFMRYCFGDVSTIEDIQEDTNGKIATLLGQGGSIQAEYIDSDGELKIVYRDYQGWDTDRTVKDQSGNSTSILAPPAFFSQGELTRIASNPTTQLELIDRYIDLEEENSAEASAIETQRAVAARLQELSTQRRTILEELEDKETGLAATKESYRALEKTLTTPIFSEFPKWESENRYIDGFREGLAGVLSSFDEAVGAVDPKTHLPPKPDTDSPNFELLTFVDGLGDSLKDALAKAKEDFAAVIGQKLSDLEELVAEWKEKFAEKGQEHQRSVDELGELDLRRAQARLRSLRVRLDNLEEKKKRHDALETQIRKKFDERNELLVAINDARGRRYEKRATKAAHWEQLFRSKIRVQITRASDRRGYVEILKSLARGAKLRESELKLLADSLHPNSLVDRVLTENATQLAKSSGLRLENCQKLINTLQARELSELLELAVAPIHDFPEIGYEVEPGRYKALHELSVGGKGTVIISLALIEGQSPLIIDQPEEPLDTLAIHDQVVGTLRREKDDRQFIFTTHNPNVAVGGDAELSHILEASADRGSIKSSGGVDKEETNRLLLHHLEGGGVAFDLRAKKYVR
jgi:predicted metal-dependent phosphoesterase TrpH/predicted nuclease with TOPRIM domain